MKILNYSFAVIVLTVSFFPFVSRASGPFTKDVFVGGQGGYPVYRIPAMIVTQKGTILAFCEGRKTGIADHGNLDIVLKRSFDGGRSWGPLQVIVKKGFVTWGNPAPVVDRDAGTVWLLFCKDNNKVFVTNSEDDGASWAAPREITKDVKKPGWAWYATGPGHAIQLSSGRLLVSCDHSSAKGFFSHVIFSDDHGQTWQIGGTLDNKTDESMAVETTDGLVYLAMRNRFGKKRRAYAWSHDEGLTFSPVQIEEQLVSPTCQASIVRFSTIDDSGKNRILFMNPASENRENMSIRISYDEGISWSGPRTVHAGPAAYSDLAVLPGENKAAGLFENGKRWPHRKITFISMDIDWITDGKDSLEK